jgi:aldehyde oxidoreductase
MREHHVHGETMDWIDAKFPTMKTAFDMDVMLNQTPRKRGPLDAVAVAEFTLLPTRAAIVAEIQDATSGERICHLPATPERVPAAMDKGGRAS